MKATFSSVLALVLVASGWAVQALGAQGGEDATAIDRANGHLRHILSTQGELSQMPEVCRQLDGVKTDQDIGPAARREIYCAVTAQGRGTYTADFRLAAVRAGIIGAECGYDATVFARAWALLAEKLYARVPNTEAMDAVVKALRFFPDGIPEGYRGAINRAVSARLATPEKPEEFLKIMISAERTGQGVETVLQVIDACATPDGKGKGPGQ
jgi:hypothetical protein